MRLLPDLLGDLPVLALLLLLLLLLAWAGRADGFTAGARKTIAALLV